MRAVSAIGFQSYHVSESRLWLGCYGLLPLPRVDFDCRALTNLRAALPGRSDEALAGVLSRFIKSFGLIPRQGVTEFQRSSVHRYMTATAGLLWLEDGDDVVVDYLYMAEALASWLVSLRLDGVGKCDTSSGLLYEEWVAHQVGLLETAVPWNGPSHVNRGLQVRTEDKNAYTDLDVVVAWPPWLLIIQCKSRIMRDEHFRGQAQDVRDRWNTLHKDLLDWDETLQLLFNDPATTWCDLNPELAVIAQPCTLAVGIVATPRVEWIPQLTPELVLHPGGTDLKNVDGLPVPRICTFDDLVRLRALGGPGVPKDAAWVIKV